MKKTIYFFIIIATLLISGCTKRVDEDKGYLASEMSIKFKPDVSRETIESILEQHGSKIAKDNGNNSFRIKISQNLTQMTKTFESLDDVESASSIRQVQIVLK